MLTISSTTLDFLEALSAHNNREWFHANKAFYQQARQDFEKFIEKLLQRVDEFYPLGLLRAKDCIYRQQRDIRFSKDKTPYTTHMSAIIAPGGKKMTHIPFYLRIKPDGVSMLGAGAWECSAQQLYQIRQEIDYNPQPLKDILAAPSFRQYFGDLKGERLKRPPKGYQEDHPDIAILKQKEFYAEHILTEKEYRAPDFMSYVVEVFLAAFPLVTYLNHAWVEAE